MDFKSPEFAAWLVEEGLRRRPDESPITFGRRVCDYVGNHLKWVYPAKLDKVSVACRFTTGECGSFSQLFVALMRANGIPARSLRGRWVSPGNGPLAADKGEGHVKSEFYADGIGWVPVDANFRRFGEEQANFIALIAGDDKLLVQHPRRGLVWIGLQETFVDALDGEGSGAERKTFYATVPLRGKGE